MKKKLFVSLLTIVLFTNLVSCEGINQKSDDSTTSSLSSDSSISSSSSVPNLGTSKEELKKEAVTPEEYLKTVGEEDTTDSTKEKIFAYYSYDFYNNRTKLPKILTSLIQQKEYSSTLKTTTHSITFDSLDNQNYRMYSEGYTYLDTDNETYSQGWQYDIGSSSRKQIIQTSKNTTTKTYADSSNSTLKYHIDQGSDELTGLYSFPQYFLARIFTDTYGKPKTVNYFKTTDGLYTATFYSEVEKLYFLFTINEESKPVAVAYYSNFDSTSNKNQTLLFSMRYYLETLIYPTCPEIDDTWTKVEIIR
jgi:hypothetical protein